MPETELHGSRVHLRPLTTRDLAEVSRLVSEPGVSLWWIDGSEAGLCRALVDAPDTASWSVLLDGHLVGVVSAFDAGWPPGAYVGLAIALGDSWQDQGFGPEALSLVIAHIANTRKVHRFTIDPAAENARAIRAYEKLGFRRVGVMRRSELGRDGEWRDCMLMDLLIDEFVDHSVGPK